MITSDTIIAPATAVGEGGIAVVRISGPRALSALQEYFQPTSQVQHFKSQQLYHGILVDADRQHIDEVMAVYMAAPHTYTRDEVVEIHCHGSQQVVKAILSLYFSYGLRMAEAGEFTYRAFINGRLDLSQAEAVAQLIHAKSDSSRKLALAQVEGHLSQVIHRITDTLRNIQVLFEAWIDFPEEDLPEHEITNIQSKINQLINKIDEITGTYNSGKLLLEGASILLVGRPNVGKSSLMNYLLGEERAIVTDIPGTTRDLLEEGVTIAGLPVRLVDTAGLRDSQDPIEMEGVKRARNKIGHADLVLFLVDGSRAISEEDLFAYEGCQGTTAFTVKTKLDLTQCVDTSFTPFPEFGISTKTGQGINELKRAIGDYLLGDHLPGSDSVMLTEQRHYDALLACRHNLASLLVAMDNDVPLECLVIEVRGALHHLGQISGVTTVDSVLEKIFSQFCIGK